MERDTFKEQLPLPTKEEAVVIERILGRCLHGDTQRSLVRRFWTSTCNICGNSMELGMEGHDEPISPAEEARRWRASLPRPATHLVVAEQALANATRAGWNVQFRQTSDSYVCTLTRGERTVRSMKHPTRAAAIVDALAQMASEYRFVG